jgi:hypothetical protein
MPQSLTVSVENNFTKGLITESTGLNFPENAATDTDNCLYTLIGDTSRREGIDLEEGFATLTVSRSGKACNTYKWNNASGDGETQIVVSQIGSVLYFYKSSDSTETSPVSTTLLTSLDITQYVAYGSVNNPGSVECQFADGNGYLIVYNPYCDPFYCTYSGGVLRSKIIQIQIRDFTGVLDTDNGVSVRPTTLSHEHLYNLNNQGWIENSPWEAQSATLVTFSTGASLSMVIGTGFTIANGDRFLVKSRLTGNDVASGTVSSYAGSTVNFTVDAVISTYEATGDNWQLISISSGYISTWFNALAVYPSNADVWWRYKDSTDTFDPATTNGTVTADSTPAPKGHFILQAFNQSRNAAYAGSGINDVRTSIRPRTGAWFQGRVWYTGVDDSQDITPTTDYYSWTENIYFSQVVQKPDDLGNCYQQNDPTSENLFDLLPTDGGVFTIQGCGAIYKLFPIQNGMLVFAANGVWFITGSQGIGFTANDYTITKLSNVASISSTSFVNVMGLPYFWNEEGIYTVQPQQGGSLSVEAITVGTILTFYNSIPIQSKKYVRGDYHPIDYVIQWVYRGTSTNGTTDELYNFDKILNYNVYNKAFYPYTIAENSSSYVNGIIYLSYPGGSDSPIPVFKYPCSYITDNSYFTFADEHDEDYVDWFSVDGIGSDYTSYFITGYKLRGKAIMKFQPQYIQVFSRANGRASAYKIQGLWDFSNSRNSGRWTNQQLITNALTRYDTVFRRHKIRGRGFALQFKITSVSGQPFDIQGWAVVDTVNQGT